MDNFKAVYLSYQNWKKPWTAQRQTYPDFRGIRESKNNSCKAQKNEL